ncbi:MAG: DUF2156 domain-containing protein [Lachnospiraceae bacterium]|nr:DUF2156 domain-containing protein [Lachnospiraceae bacterium]
MRDQKKYYDMPVGLSEGLRDLGYRLVMPEDQSLFDPYYDRMNGTWTSSSCFPNFIGWMDSFEVYIKIVDDMIINMIYLRNEGYLICGPFLGKYETEKIKKLVGLVDSEFRILKSRMIFMDIADWMLPYYQAAGIEFEVEDDRDASDYVFTPEEFTAGMDAQDDRYRRRYFERKFNYETVEITSAHADEIDEFMDRNWCDITGCDACHSGCLKKVILNIVNSFETLRVNGILVRVDNELAGLCIVSCRNKLGVYQYKNAINRLKGINEYLLYESYERFLKDADIINYTEDMGEESLRYYKEHMAPSFSLSPRLTLKSQGNYD